MGLYLRARRPAASATRKRDHNDAIAVSAQFMAKMAFVNEITGMSPVLNFMPREPLFALGIARAPAKSLLEHALPEMRKLTLEIRQSCHLALASDEQMVVVARIEAPGNQGYSVRVGYPARSG